MDPRRIFAHIFSIETIIAFVVFGLVCLALIVAGVLSSYRKRHGKPPWRKAEHSPVEGGYALAVAAVVGFVVYLSFHATAQEDAKAPRPAAKVTVTAFQWCWRFGYPGTARTVTATCDANDLPTLVVPVGRPVQIDLRSSDVIHSWWVPELRYKLDAFPDHTNTVTITVDKAGRWIGRCAQFCGDRHTYMDFYLKAVPEAQYQQWLATA